MLRNRSKAVTTKQALMSDQMEIPLLSLSKSTSTSTSTSSISISSLISPRLLTKNHQEFEASLISPKSILDTKNSSPSSPNPFNYPPSKPQSIINSNSNSNSCNNNNNNKRETQGIGLALIDSLNQDQENECKTKPFNRMALFSSNLKVQIPPPTTAATPPVDFGIKSGNSHVAGAGVSPAREFKLSRQLSLKEMEQSEDYTCVIIHGPNPKTTHIFDDCIVETCNCECDTNDANKFGSNHSSSHSQFQEIDSDPNSDAGGRNKDDALLDSLSLS